MTERSNEKETKKMAQMGELKGGKKIPRHGFIVVNVSHGFNLILLFGYLKLRALHALEGGT